MLLQKCNLPGIILVSGRRTKKGFVLLPRRWVVDRSFGWAACFRRLVRDYERLPETLAGLHFLAFAILMLKRVVETMLILHRSYHPLV